MDMSAEPLKDEWIRQLILGKSFADIGGLGGSAVNETVTIALEAGASEATLIDVLPLEHPFWEDFEERCRERHLENYRKLQGDVNRLDPDETGTFEMVHCSGVLYHMPDPVSTILRLRSVTERYLILSSAVVPDRIATSEGAELNLPSGGALFVPALGGCCRRDPAPALERVRCGTPGCGSGQRVRLHPLPLGLPVDTVRAR